MKLIIAEKRDQAAKIGKFMGWSDKKTHWEGKLEGDLAKVVWGSGHLVRLKNPDEMVEGLNWNSLEGLTPIPKEYSLLKLDNDPKSNSSRCLKRIQENIKDASEVIISTDSDREGETLAWMILEYLGYNGPVRRAWLAGGLDKKTITTAFANLRSPGQTRSWARAGEARARSDRAYMFLVRAYTYFARYGVFGRDLGEGKGRGGVMGMGRVQTPTLNMVVRREEEIENFVPVKHYKVLADFTAQGANGSVEAEYIPRVTEQVIEAKPEGVHWEPSKEPPNAQGDTPLDRPLFVDENRVQQFKNDLMANADKVRILSYTEGKSETKPPKTYSLSDAQGDIGRKLKIDGDVVQTILEDLYEQGWISYARTSKSDLPMSVYDAAERNQCLGALMDIPSITEQAQKAMAIHDGRDTDYQPFKPAVFTTKDLEHHGIIPTSQKMTKVAFEKLTPKKAKGKKGIQHDTLLMQEAYLLVARRFIQTLYPPAKYSTQEIQLIAPVKDLLNADDALFKARARRLEDPGFKAAFGDNGDDDGDDEVSLPTLQQGDSATITKVHTKDSVTKPPVRYTSVTLPVAMEKIAREITDPNLRKRLKVAEGIGTPATRTAIIETLLARNYISENKKKHLIPTKRGRDLIKSVPKWLSSPETTAVWEDYLSQICDIKEDDDKTIEMRDLFVNKQIEKIEKLIESLKVNYNDKLGERIGGGGSVTPKMKKLIQLIADRIGQKVDPEIFKDFQKAKEFLDQYAGDNAQPIPPSEKQLAFGKKVFDAVPNKESINWGEVSKDGKSLSKFIDQNKKHLDAQFEKQPPSPAQIKFAKSLAEKLSDDQKPSESIYESRKACSDFINSQTGGGKKTDKKGGPKKKAQA